MNTDQLQAFLGVYLQSPPVMITILLLFSIATPLIEEAVKPIALILFRRNLSPRDGFMYGLVCGAAFAFFETLLSGFQSAPADWLVLIVTRTGTGLLHMFTAGLVGMGLIAAFEKRSFMAWFRNYILAVVIHGMWNTTAILSGIAEFSQAAGEPIWQFIQIAAPVGMVLISVGIISGLITIRRKLTRSISPIQADPNPTD